MNYSRIEDNFVFENEQVIKIRFNSDFFQSQNDLVISLTHKDDFFYRLSPLFGKPIYSNDQEFYYNLKDTETGLVFKAVFAEVTYQGADGSENTLSLPHYTSSTNTVETKKAIRKFDDFLDALTLGSIENPDEYYLKSLLSGELNFKS